MGDARLEPSIGLRTWTQQASSLSLQTTFSLRYDRPMGPVTVTPGAGFTIGKLAARNATTGAQESASLSGFRAQLTIRTH